MATMKMKKKSRKAAGKPKIAPKASKPKASNDSPVLIIGSYVPVRSLDVLARKNTDGTVAVLRLDNDQFFYSIDGIAAEAWALIDGKTPLKAIIAKLAKKYSPPSSRFERDMESFIADLRREKLLAA